MNIVIKLVRHEKRNDKITDAYLKISKSHKFISEVRSIRKHYQGRPTPIYYCNRLSEKYKYMILSCLYIYKCSLSEIFILFVLNTYIINMLQ